MYIQPLSLVKCLIFLVGALLIGRVDVAQPFLLHRLLCDCKFISLYLPRHHSRYPFKWEESVLVF